MSKDNLRAGKILFTLFTIIFIIIGLISSVASFILNKNFFLKYSPDEVLKEETLQKIQILRISIAIIGFISFLAVLFVLNKRAGTIRLLENHKSMIINLLLFFAVIFIVLIIGELTLRIIIYDETSGHGASPGSLKFNEKHVTLNKDGFRDFEYSLDKTKDTTRIAVIGDSFTFGMGVKNVNDTYPKVLEKELNELNLSKRFEVLNFGIPGYDSPQHLQTIKDYALKYKPDIIIIGYVLNDLPNVEGLDVKYQKIELPFIGFWLRSSSYLYYFLESRLNEILRSNSQDYNYESILGRLYNSSANKNASKEIYKEIGQVAEDNNISIMIVTFPIIYKLDNYSFLSAHNHVKEFSNENNFLYKDLLGDYQKYSEHDLVVNKYDAHPNELGQKIAADAIFNFLKKRISF